MVLCKKSDYFLYLDGSILPAATMSGGQKMRKSVCCNDSIRNLFYLTGLHDLTYL